MAFDSHQTSDRIPEGSQQQSTSNFNVLDLYKGAQIGPHDTSGTAKDYLPSISFTGGAYPGHEIGSQPAEISQAHMPGVSQPIEVGTLTPGQKPIDIHISDPGNQPIDIRIGTGQQPIEVGSSEPIMPVEQGFTKEQPISPGFPANDPWFM